MEKNEEGVDDDPFESITFYLNFHCSLMETQRAAQPRQWCFARVERGRGGLFIDFLVAHASYITRRVLCLFREINLPVARAVNLSPLLASSPPAALFTGRSAISAANYL